MKTLLMLGAAFALSVTAANAECPPNYMPYGPLCAATGYDNTDPDKPAPTIDPDKPALVADPNEPAPTRRIITQLFDTNGKRIGQMVQDGDVVSYFNTVPAWPLIPQLSERTRWSRHIDAVTEVNRRMGNDPNANAVDKPGGIGSDYVASRPAEPQQQTADCSLAATPELEAQCRGDEVVVAK
jgi:hypothetical protein